MNDSIYKIPGLALNTFILKKEPFSIVHFVTNKCNARCKHCFIDLNNPDIAKDELSLAEINKLTKSLGKSLFNVNLTGGEPFIRKDIFEIARSYFTNTDIQSLFITTNGFFTDRIKSFLDEFVSSGIKGNITLQFSIDNFEEEHDKNRRVKGLFRKTIESYHLVKSYKSANIMPNICITLTDHNYHKVLDLYKHLKALGIDSCTATIMREAGVVKTIDPDLKKELLNTYLKLTRQIRNDQLSGAMKGFERHLQGRLMNSKNMLVHKVIKEAYVETPWSNNIGTVSRLSRAISRNIQDAAASINPGGSSAGNGIRPRREPNAAIQGHSHSPDQQTYLTLWLLCRLR